ncbi:MAG: hypothetical protein ACFCU1_00020 [Sumerlaeia bacterium]
MNSTAQNVPLNSSRQVRLATANPNRFSRLFSAFGAAVLLTLSAAPLAALEPMVVAPEKSEVVARVNVAQALQSPLSGMIIDEYGRQNIESTAKLIQNLTDVNLFADLYEAWLFGQIDSDEEVLILARGQFNETKLVDLLRVNNTFKETTYLGETVYSWTDENNLPRWAVFIGQYLAIGGTNEIIRGVVDRQNATTGGFQQTPIAKALPQNLNRNDFWLVISSERYRTIEFAAMAEAIDLKYLLLTASHTDERVTVTGMAVPLNPEDTQEYKAIGDGALALSRLMEDGNVFARLAANTVTVTQEAEGVAATAELSNAEALNLLYLIREY